MTGKRKPRQLGRQTIVRVDQFGTYIVNDKTVAARKRLVKEIQRKIKIYHEAINALTDDTGFDEMEKLMARVAYLNLNALRNSLHRFLVKKDDH